MTRKPEPLTDEQLSMLLSDYAVGLFRIALLGNGTPEQLLDLLKNARR